MEKTPSNLLKMRFLQALFPGSSFVVVLRHPVAEAMALRARGWSRRSVGRLVDHWVRAHEVMAEDLPLIERVVVVRYEDLVTQPADVLGALQAFLGLGRVATGEEPRRDLNDRYLGGLAVRGCARPAGQPAHGEPVRVGDRSVRIQLLVPLTDRPAVGGTPGSRARGGLGPDQSGTGAPARGDGGFGAPGGLLRPLRRAPADQSSLVKSEFGKFSKNSRNFRSSSRSGVPIRGARRPVVRRSRRSRLDDHGAEPGSTDAPSPPAPPSGSQVPQVRMIGWAASRPSSIGSPHTSQRP